MNILLTNDDGIYAPGIFALYQELKKVGKVTVVAPDSEKSSVGHGITLAHPLWVKKINRRGKFFGFGISGTPADCVKFGVSIILKRKPDLIVSGINLGPNDGCSVFYSGTVAGAREGALLNIPSIAVSLDTFINPDFSYAAKFSASLSRKILKWDLPPRTFLNVNVPNKRPRQIKGVCVVRQGIIPIHGDFSKRADPNLRTYYWMTGKNPPLQNALDTDTNALHKNYITISPIHSDLTDYATLSRISKLIK